MKSEFCAMEEAVTQALSSGVWTEELRAHVNGCAHCAEVPLVWEWLNRAELEREAAAGPLPAPGSIWWRAELAERRERAERAVAGMVALQTVAVAVVLITFLTLGWLVLPHRGTVPLSSGILGLCVLFTIGNIVRTSWSAKV